jgi:PleD family two-component response regulator
MKVLIVDDDLYQNKVYKLMFENEDIEVRTLLGDEDIISEAVKFCPDMVLLDVNLGNKSGFDVVVDLKKHEQTRHIPIIFVSSDKSPETVSRSFFLGGVEFIEKTPDVKAIVKHVKEMALLEGISVGLARVKQLLDQRE